MPRIQVDKITKNLRDLTVIRKLNKEGYSLNLQHVTSISGDLSPDELEALLSQLYLRSKGKTFFEILVEDFRRFRKKYWSNQLKNKRVLIIFICLAVIGLLISTIFLSDKILFSSGVPVTIDELDYEIEAAKEPDKSLKSEADQHRLDYAMKVLKGVDELIKLKANQNIDERMASQENITETPEAPSILKASIDVKDFNDNFIKDRRCNGIRSDRITFNFEITVDASGSANLVNYLGDIDNLIRSEKKLLKITQDGLLETSFIPGRSDGKAIESVIRQLVTIPKGFCK